MAVRSVGPNSDFPSIAAAMQAAGPGDTIELEAGYSNETATVSFSGMTITGGAGSTGIVLNLGLGIATVTLDGTAPFQLVDASDGNGIVGNDGDNRITVTGGVDAVDGGLGEDGLVIDYRDATGAVTGNSTSNFTEAGGGGRMVTITDGTFENFKILTGSGADTITTGDGDDTIKTGAGASTVSAGQGANTIIGGSGADTITALDGGNTVNAGDGTNTVTTGAGADEISAGVGADTIVSGQGDDRIFLFGGADDVDTGGGDDRLVIDYAALTTDVTGGITGGNGNTGYVGLIADLLGNSVDFEGSESFYITTGSGDDTLTTGKGDDVLRGGGGEDVFDAGQGDDQVTGGGGADELRGGRGADVVTGGGGADVFVFGAVKEANASSGRDLIRDVETGIDRIDLRGMDADADEFGNQAFVFVGAAKFSSEAGELRYAKGVVSGDVDGDGRADFAIEIGNDADLRAGDFQL
jgi:Ca2+-binding RTX toxin-like protein